MNSKYDYLDEHDEDDLATTLTPEQVIAAEEMFKADPEKALLACRLIAMGMAMARIDNASTDSDGASLIFRGSDVEFAADAGARDEFIEKAIGWWHEPLLRAIELPADAWPEGMTPIEAWLNALRDFDKSSKV